MPDKDKKTIDKEMRVHSALKHANVLEFLCAVVVDPRQKSPYAPGFYMLLEFAAGGDLFDKIAPDVGVGDEIAHYYFGQLVNGMNYIHEQGVCHRDLKPENLLLDAAGTLKISDFGLSAVFMLKETGKKRSLTERCGSLPYVAPELNTDAAYEAAPIDVWGVGVILYTLLAGNTPWDEPTKQSPEFCRYRSGEIFKELPWSRIDPLALSLIRGLLTIDPAQRMTLANVYEHPWCIRPSQLANRGVQELADKLTASLRANGDLGYAAPVETGDSAMDTDDDGDEVMLSGTHQSQFTQSLLLFSGRRYTPHLTRFYASIPPSALMPLAKATLEELGVKCKLGEAIEGGALRLRVGGYDQRKVMFKGWVEIERFAYRGTEGSFCIMQRDEAPLRSSNLDMPSPTEKALVEAEKNAKTNPARAEQLYKQILSSTAESTNADAPQTGAKAQSLRDQETALVKLGELYRDTKNAKGLADVITLSRAFMSSTAKAKTAKLIRTLLDFFIPIPNSQQIQMDVLVDNIEWAKKEKRIFLKHSLETRLVSLQLESQKYKPALALIDTLLTELKRLDDKMILTEVHLLESRVYRGIGNLSKSKAALTSARTAANSIYCPPHLQAQLDLQSGVLHAEDKDYTTGYSYFFETFENLSSQDDPGALEALKYMLLCKVMLNLPEDVTSLLSIKLVVKYAQMREVESMRAIARAHQNRNLSDFEKALRDYKEELSSDPTIRSHLAALYDTLLEQNLLRIVEPYSVVEIEFVAQQVGQGRQDVEAKLSQMILDKVFHGVLDQGRGCLLVFDQPEADNTYGAAIDTLEQIGKVVDSLYAKTVKIT
ncbi:hypothetical protein HWV62_13295 [Athelia sp. TMB]|nr:hypothetical protein HWV62_13295 [Athelia sp. TMB]